jgi:hypothetical protein
VSDSPKCRTCCKPIAAKARYCTECEHYQDWRRFFSIGQIFLTLMIALISVLSTGLPPILTAAKRDGSKVVGSYYKCHRDDVELVVSNLGNRDAILRDVGFRLIIDGRPALSPEASYDVTAMSVNGEKAAPFIDAGHSVLYKMARQLGEPFPAPGSSQGQHTCHYEFTLRVVEFDHLVSQPTIMCGCDS